MTAARGLPDFASAIATEGGTLYRAAEESNHFLHAPTALAVALSENGRPDLSLELVRATSPAGPPKPYGVLDLRVTAPAPDAAVLAAARAADPRAFVTPAVFGAGFLRLQAIAGQGAIDPALRAGLAQPVAIASNGLDATRLVRRLTREAVLLLRAGLLDGALTTVAVAELTLRGIADRLPASVTFSPQALLDALLARADDQRRITVDAIERLWALESGGVPLLAADGLDGPERLRRARVLTDWTLAAFCAPAAAPGEDVAATVRLQPPAALPARLTWDLAQARLVTRTLVLRLDPFEAARALGGEQFWHETVVPTLETGFVHFEVDTNLPHPLVNVARAGGQLRAAPHPPDRPGELTAALMFDARQQPQTVKWRLSPKEELRYTYACFALVRLGTTTRRLDQPPVETGARRLLLGVDDLPVELIAVSAGKRLLAESTVHAVLSDGKGEGEGERIEFGLTAAQPQLAAALLPGTAERFSLQIEARPLDGSPPVALAPLPARSVGLDVSSFPQFGAQEVEVTVAFDVDVPVLALELAPERDGGPPAVVTLSPEEPRELWRYVNPSPFRSGYRYRLHGTEAWSDVQPAGSPLALRASELTAQAGFEFEDLYCVAGAEPGSYLVVPLKPGPERDGDGRPMLTLISLGDRGSLLTLGAQLGPDGDAVERLRDGFVRRGGNPVVTLSVPPIEVTGAVLSLAGADGTLHEVARKPTSNLPPFTALFNELLEPDRADAVEAALAGVEGQMLVHFDARWRKPTRVTVVVRGDLRPAIARIREVPGDREPAARGSLQVAFATGELRVEGEGTAADLQVRAIELLLPLVLAGAAFTELRFTYHAAAWTDLSSSMDLAGWFAARSLPDSPTR